MISNTNVYVLVFLIKSFLYTVWCTKGLQLQLISWRVFIKYDLKDIEVNHLLKMDIHFNFVEPLFKACFKFLCPETHWTTCDPRLGMKQPCYFSRIIYNSGLPQRRDFNLPQLFRHFPHSVPFSKTKLNDKYSNM